MKSCYLAGPMRGYPEYNFPAFFAAAKSLRERGIEVWSPAENDVHADGFNPATDTHQPMRHYMKRDLPAVLEADFVAVLSGWERSQGACLEVHVARTCGIPVLWASDLSAVAEELRTGWQPIETVPRDGTVVLLHYSMNHLCGYASSVRPKKKIAVGYFDGRWVDGRPGGHGEGGADYNYTHWMPLPAAPEGEG